MSEELNPIGVHDANVFLPGSLGPVRREVVLAYEHDRVVDKLRAELAAIKAAQGETGDAPQCWWIDHGSHGQITQRQDEAESAVREGKRVVRYTAAGTAPPATGVIVPLDRHALGQAASEWLTENDPDGLDWCDSRNVDALIEALLAQSQEVKS